MSSKGRYRLQGHCGNRGVFNPECMIGCDPGWCMHTPEENAADMERHRASLAAERAALKDQTDDR